MIVPFFGIPNILGTENGLELQRNGHKTEMKRKLKGEKTITTNDRVMRPNYHSLRTIKHKLRSVLNITLGKVLFIITQLHKWSSFAKIPSHCFIKIDVSELLLRDLKSHVHG